METVNSSNPNNTSGRAVNATSSLSYPKAELLTKRTVLKFVKYDRETPASNPTSDVTAIINLPIPLNIPENIDIKTGNYNMGVRGNTEEIIDYVKGGKLIDGLKNVISGIGDGVTAKEAARALALTPIKLNDDRGALSNIYGGVVRNPHTTAFFDGVGLRSFSLNWKLSARSQEESDIINSIVKTMRERILPEESFRGWALDYPDLVYVDFEGSIKPYMPQYYRSFISNLNINTSSSSGMVFYKSGAPVEVEIQAQFVETNIITRNVLRGEGF